MAKAKAEKIEETYGKGDGKTVDRFCDAQGEKYAKSLKRHMSRRNIKNSMDRPRISFEAVKSNDGLAREQLFDLVKSQKWPGLTVANNTAHGRAIIATDVFEIGDILLDYHGKEISLEEDERIRSDQGTLHSDYLFRVTKYDMSIDSFDEFCECHPRMRTFGRLINWVSIGTFEANVYSVPYHLESLNKCMKKVPIIGVLFVAKRKIIPLDEIRYDNGETADIDLFTPLKTSNGKGKLAPIIRPTDNVPQQQPLYIPMNLPSIEEGFSTTQRQLNPQDY